ncbi:uncharacterized protein LOC110835830 [Zootermopsis nevadensis]|uniref:Uncharacterized protein n=1 Tax=Zootermopsis nevadensis TaxID=136037 RepID=A0A067R1Z6_ZOONE|nr:uncharacterized protein LOC110835830 [Zootermopsis nevadensis]KDR12906.1 hypothetical protein L798_13132 [Zootermopsis nevadensis]
MFSMRTPIFIISLSLFGLALGGDDLKTEFLKKAQECVKEGNVDVVVCKELLDEGVDDTQDKYTPCKCATACMAKKFGTMDANGALLKDEIQKFIPKLTNIQMKKEAERVFPVCYEKVSEKKDCEAAYLLSKCSTKMSSMGMNAAKYTLDYLLEKKD